MKLVPISENHLFSKAYTRGKKWICRNTAVYVLRDAHANREMRANPRKEKINRIGITVSKKVGGAVVRNRVKRIIREAYRTVEREHGVRKGYLIVIVARNTAADKKTQDIYRDLLFAFRNLQLLTTADTDTGASKPKRAKAKISADGAADTP